MIETTNLPKDWYILVGIHGHKGTIMDTQIAMSESTLYQKLEMCKSKLPRMRYFTYKVKKVELI